MSDGLDIRSGGVVAVDTESLRAAAEGFTDLSGELIDIERVMRSLVMRLAEIHPVVAECLYTAEALAGRADAASTAAGSLADRLRYMAAVYEIVELRAAADLAAPADDPGEAARIAAETDARISTLERQHPWASLEAGTMTLIRRLVWPFDIVAQAGLGGMAVSSIVPGAQVALPLGMLALAFGVAGAGGGTVDSRSRLAPLPTPVEITPLASVAPAPAAGSSATVAPAGLAAAAERIPAGTTDTRVRVETYTMRDGTRQFAVYVAGTRDSGTGGSDPFDMESNLQLYGGDESASYRATAAALREAGAQPGDIVHAFGHSQGAMIAAHLALEGGYDTRTLVSFGSPVEADVGEGTLSIALRHTDDPVAMLEGGGHAQGVGAPGSFVAERVADREAGVRDARLPAHGIAGYAETAGMLDASADPRMAPVRDLFEELGTATSVDVVEYSARRFSDPSASDGG